MDKAISRSDFVKLCLKVNREYDIAAKTKYNKDCSEFTVAEIINFYKSLCSTSFYTMKNTNGFLKAYTSYCIKNNLVKDGQNHYTEISDELLKDLGNKKRLGICLSV